MADDGGFDLSTAKPVDDGFDLSTAKPVTPEAPGMLGRIGHDVADWVGTAAHGVGTAVDIARNDYRAMTGQPTIEYGGPDSAAATLSAPFKHDAEPNQEPAPQWKNPVSAVAEKLYGPAWDKFQDQLTAGPAAQTIKQDVIAPAGDAAQGLATIAGIPGVARAAAALPMIKPVAAFASDILPGGGERAATRIIQNAAGDHAQAAAALGDAANSGALAARKAGFQPTTAQLANNAGLAQLDRTLRNQGDLTKAFGERDVQNQQQVKSILEGISGTPEERLRAGAARDFQARTMYDDALHNPEHYVQPPGPDDRSFAAEEAAKQGLTQDGVTPQNDPTQPAQGLNDMGTRLQELLKRPAIKTAMANASNIAANFGQPYDERNLIQQLHYAKMHLDDQIGAAKQGNKPNELRALIDAKTNLLSVMDDLSPAYKEARTNYQAASRPINRMEVGEALRQKYSPALNDFGGVSTRPAMLANALRAEDGDTIAQQATDFQGARMRKILTPQDYTGLNAIKEQLGRENFAQNAGRSVGSPTAANLESQRAIDNVGSIHGALDDMGLPAQAALAFHHPAIAVPLGLAGGVGRRRALMALADMMLDPTRGAEALAKTPVNLPSTKLLGAAPLYHQATGQPNFADISPPSPAP